MNMRRSKSADKYPPDNKQSAKLLILVFYFDSLTLINLFINTNIFREYSTHDLLSIIYLIVFVLSKALIVSRLINNKIVHNEILSMTIFILSILSHQELNIISFEKVEQASQHVFMNRLAFAAISITATVVYSEISDQLLKKSRKYALFIVATVSSFFQHFNQNVWISQVLAAVVTGMVTWLYVWLRFEPIHVAGKLAGKFGTREREVSPVSHSKPPGTKIEIAQERAPPVDAKSDHEPNGSQRGSVFGAPVAQIDNDASSKLTSLSHIHLRKSKIERLNSGVVDIAHLSTLLYDLCINLNLKTGQIVSATENVRELKQKNIYEQLLTKIQMNKRIETVGWELEDKVDDSLSTAPNKEPGPVERFTFHSYDKLRKKVILRSTHRSLQELIDAVRKQFLREDGKPFSELLNQNMVSFSKCNSLKTIPKFHTIKHDGEFTSTSGIERVKLDENGAPFLRKATDLLPSDRPTPLEVVARINLSLPSVSLNKANSENSPTPRESNFFAEVKVSVGHGVGSSDLLNEEGSAKVLPNPTSTPEVRLCFKKMMKAKKISKDNKFLNLVSHEMRSPLVAILGMIQLFITKSSAAMVGGGISEVKNLMNTYLISSVSHIQNLLDACQLILDLAKNEGNQPPVKATEFNLKNLIRDACKLVLELNKHKTDVYITYQYDNTQDDFIKSDPVRIRQIILNLLSNAIKYTTKGTVSVIVTKLTFYKIKIAIKDTGIGIREEDLGKLFKEFGRIKNSQDEQLNRNGVGLGLQFSNMLAQSISPKEEKFGILVESSFGKGSEFSFMVENQFLNQVEADIFKLRNITPIMQEALVREINSLKVTPEDRESLLRCTMRKASIAAKSKFKCVLVVDDSELILEMMEALLYSAGLEAVLCSNPTEALDIIKEKLGLACRGCNKFDMVITDGEMPYMSGVELATEIRKLSRYQNIPVICASANEIVGEEAAYFTETMLKPISSTDVQYLLSKYLRGSDDHTCEGKNRSVMDSSASGNKIFNSATLQQDQRISITIPDFRRPSTMKNQPSKAGLHDTRELDELEFDDAPIPSEESPKLPTYAIDSKVRKNANQ